MKEFYYHDPELRLWYDDECEDILREVAAQEQMIKDTIEANPEEKYSFGPAKTLLSNVYNILTDHGVPKRVASARIYMRIKQWEVHHTLSRPISREVFNKVKITAVKAAEYAQRKQGTPDQELQALIEGEVERERMMDSAFELINLASDSGNEVVEANIRFMLLREVILPELKKGIDEAAKDREL